jgi:para-aminobenzoate synthetase/4-amino-4-deoxychorismate lyase
LERGPRGVYTGVIGAFFPHDKALFNVAIRTLFARPSGNAVHCSMGIGGGIVQDSALDTEYEECLLKSAFLNDDERDFRLFETLRYASDNGFYLLKQHLGRMRVSAHALGFLFDESAASNALNNAVAGTKTDYLRVKLLLSKTGEWETIQSAFPSELIGKPLSFVLADQSVDSRNPLLLHKTTRRALFDEAFADMQRKTACDEILFLNERGELTQGSYTNLFIRLRKGEPWLTPPLSSGLLPGTLRSFLLESGEAEERTLHPPDLENAEVVCLGNALRGLVKGIIPK